jgi:hypothetical protein
MPAVRARPSSIFRDAVQPFPVSSATVTSVADGKFEWEVENDVALFVRDDKFAAILCLSIKSLLGHDQASSFLRYFVQIIKLDALLIADFQRLSLMRKK